MAHKIRVKVVPHVNVNGSISKTKKDYIATDFSRGKTFEIGTFGSKKDCEAEIAAYREMMESTHLHKHPNDLAFVMVRSTRKAR